MACKGYMCLVALLLVVGIVRASEEISQNKLLPEDEKENGGRFFFATSTSTTDTTTPTVTLTLGTGDILFAVLAVALSIGAVVVIAGLLLGDTHESSGYSAPTSYGSDDHTGESSYAVLRSLEAAARKHE